MSRGLTLVVLIGMTVALASPFTEMTPIYLIYHEYEDQLDVVLDDEMPMLEIAYPLADKIVIEGLSTNGSSVDISMYENYFSENPLATITNVTEIRNAFLVGANSLSSAAPVIRIFRQDNQSVSVELTIRIGGSYPSTDNIMVGPSPLVLLAIPLIYSIYKYRMYKLDRHGYAIVILAILSAALISPLLVYTYNRGDSLLRESVVQNAQMYSFELNTSYPLIEFNESLTTTGSGTFVRIANLTTNGVPISITIIPDGAVEPLELPNTTTYSSNTVQIEFPQANTTSFTVQLARLSHNTTVNMSIETVHDIWTPRMDPLPPYLSGISGLVIAMVTLIIPRGTGAHLSGEVSES